MPSKRLSRQIKKAFGSENIALELGANQAQLAGQLTEFFKQVDETYDQQDEKAELAHRSLAVSSVELTEANSKLYQLNQTFDAMVNSLGQGFFLFGPDRVCLPVYSKVCETLLESVPAGKLIDEVLRVPESEREMLANWCQFLFEERMDFANVAALGPSRFPHAHGKIVTLEYKPCRDSAGKLIYIVAIATDRTVEITAQRHAEELQDYVKMVVSIVKNKGYFKRFVAEVRRMLMELESLSTQIEFSDSDLATAKRLLHTIKGTASAFGFKAIKDGCQADETAVNEFFELRAIQNYLQRAVVTMKSEFEALLASNRDVIGDLSVDSETREVEVSLLWKFAEKFNEHAETHKLKTIYISEILAIPWRKVTSEYNQPLQEIASRLEKKVSPIEFIGGDVSLIRENYRGFLSSLVHVFNNIVDHGIETPEKRTELGKPVSGRVEVEVIHLQNENRFKIFIRDDGGGIDPRRIRAKLRETGQEKLAQELSDEKIINKIFDAGFTTHAEVTDISGRGIGMDAVKSEVVKLGGAIRVESKIGKGTTFIIELPIITETEKSKQVAV